MTGTGRAGCRAAVCAVSASRSADGSVSRGWVLLAAASRCFFSPAGSPSSLLPAFGSGIEYVADDGRGFAEILQTRSGQHLKDWIIAVRTADLPRLHAFATGLERDWDAVLQGLSTRWNSGPVEGRVNHIKMIKRQMFGRAELPLLRKRVLLTAAASS